MGKAEKRRGVDCAVSGFQSLIWFEGKPVVVGDELMTAGFFLSVFLRFFTYLSAFQQFQMQRDQLIKIL